MGTEWRFSNVEHIFREHAESKGIEYDPKRPLASLDEGAIKRATELLGASTWDDFTNKLGVKGSTAKHWHNNMMLNTVKETIFPALCDFAAMPYKEHREAYENSAWLPQYIEQRAAYALMGLLETLEDTASAIDRAWQRYNVATLLFAAFTLDGEGLETVANVARYALSSPPTNIGLMKGRPYTGSDPNVDRGESELIKSEAETLEQEAINRIPDWSRVSVDFARIRSLVEERDRLRAETEG